MKEMKFRPNIADHDMQVKVKKIKKFIEKKFSVRLTMQFRGREMAHREIGEVKMKKIIEELTDYGAVINSPLKFKGTNAQAILCVKEGKKMQ